MKKIECWLRNCLQVCSGVLALKDNCLTADTKTPYIKSITGGVNSSSEGFTVRFWNLRGQNNMQTRLTNSIASKEWLYLWLCCRVQLCRGQRLLRQAGHCSPKLGGRRSSLYPAALHCGLHAWRILVWCESSDRIINELNCEKRLSFPINQTL